MVRKIIIILLGLLLVFISFVAYLYHGARKAYNDSQQKIEDESEYYIHRFDSIQRLHKYK